MADFKISEIKMGKDTLPLGYKDGNTGVIKPIPYDINTSFGLVMVRYKIGNEKFAVELPKNLKSSDVPNFIKFSYKDNKAESIRDKTQIVTVFLFAALHFGALLKTKFTGMLRKASNIMLLGYILNFTFQTHVKEFIKQFINDNSNINSQFVPDILNHAHQKYHDVQGQ